MNLRLKIPPPVWLLMFGTLMWGLHRVVPIATIIHRPFGGAGWLFVAAGAATIATAMLQFRRANTTINPTTPAKASSLVTSGVFGYSRNPMYLGLALVLAGWAILLSSLSPWVVLPLFVLVITKMQIEPEEAVLAVLFDEPYRAYCAKVGRWFGRRR